MIVGEGDNAAYMPMGDSFKLDDINEEKQLYSVMDDYKNSESMYEYMVRPWFDDDYATKPSISLITQFNLFKCMHPNCTFSTSCEEVWTKHMVKHIQLMDLFVKNDLMTNDVRNNQIKFRECPYCPTEFNTNAAVTMHISEEHNRCIFQCAYCFYRAIECDNIVLHYNRFHAGEVKEVLLTGDSREFEHKDEEAITYYSDEYITPIECSE